MRKCPNCKSSSRLLVKSKPIVQLIPGSTSYRCSECDTNYTWFRHFKKTLKL